MTNAQRCIEVIFPAFAKIVKASTKETTFTFNLKRDATLIGKRTLLTVLNEALTGTGVLALVGSAFNGQSAASSERQRETFRAFFENVGAVRDDLRSALGMTPLQLKNADALAIDEAMKRVKASGLRCVDFECFLHQCTSDKTAESYQNTSVGRQIRKAVHYDRGAKYTVTIALLDNSINQARGVIEKEAKKIAEAKAAKALKAKEAKAKKSKEAKAAKAIEEAKK